MVVETQIDGHLGLVTATLARPYVTDFVIAHVCRRLWRDQQVRSLHSLHAIPERARSVPVVNMTTSPNASLVLNGVGHKSITILRRSTCG
jgi:hypothetical protein